MPKNNSDRRAAQRTRYRTSAAAARARQRRQRRNSIVAGSVVVAIIIAIVLALLGPSVFSNDSASTTTSSTSTTTPESTTTAAPLKSVAGKPCVATKGALPKGAPAVPVETGPPPTKLVIKDLKAGTGAVVKSGQTLSVDYIGVSCSTGVIFDSSYATGKPASFPLSGVIPGWQQGLPGMKVGGERLLGIPPALAYGKDGRAPSIAPDETLWFVVTVHSAK